MLNVTADHEQAAIDLVDLFGKYHIGNSMS
jgi:hypothetical protein